jgi:hypothetical protein
MIVPMCLVASIVGVVPHSGLAAMSPFLSRSWGRGQDNNMLNRNK